MKKELLCLLLISAVSLSCFAQITYEKAYFINNNGERSEGFIKNVDWRSNPVAFRYKESLDSVPKIMTIESVKEFAFTNSAKYARYTVDIDRSPNHSIGRLDDMSTVRKSEFKNEQLFLKVLVEGKANLYEYQDKNLKRYFYAIHNAAPQPLIYKSYVTQYSKIGENNRYKQQLLNDLKCENISLKEFENLDYRKKELTAFFVKYNKCDNSEFIDFEKKEKKDLFNFTVRPGLNSSSLRVERGFNSVDFDNELSFRVGIESEFIMNFHKNKWSLIIEPTYQTYASETETNSQIAMVDYSSIDLPIGIRYYTFINEKSKIFVNASYVLSFSVDSSVSFGNQNVDIVKTTSLDYGIGYNYDRYMIEMRYRAPRGLMETFPSSYKGFSMILGYSLF